MDDYTFNIFRKFRVETPRGNSYECFVKGFLPKGYSPSLYSHRCVPAQILIERERVQASELVEIQFFHLEAMENIV